MSKRFAPVAGKLAGLTGRLLGWRPDEFWAATPAELAAILAPAAEALDSGLARSDLARMMEHDR